MDGQFTLLAAVSSAVTAIEYHKSEDNLKESGQLMRG